MASVVLVAGRVAKRIGVYLISRRECRLADQFAVKFRQRQRALRFVAVNRGKDGETDGIGTPTSRPSEDEARQEFSLLEKGDKEAVKIWKKCIELSKKEFDKILKEKNKKVALDCLKSWKAYKVPVK